MSNFSRRDFLKLCTQGLLGISGFLGIVGLVRYLSFEPDPPAPQKYNAGPITLYPIGSQIVIKEIPAILFSRSGGFQALSLVCQHLGCTVEAKSDGFVCPCHGSRYALDGQVLNGPAQKGLKNLKVEIDADKQVIIYTN